MFVEMGAVTKSGDQKGVNDGRDKDERAHQIERLGGNPMHQLRTHGREPGVTVVLQREREGGAGTFSAKSS
jgi:hypothetical protein